MYLALAVSQSIKQESIYGGTISGKVIATEKEPTNAARARENWKLAGTEVEQWIELREGDLLETLRIEEGMPGKIDLLLLDSKLLSGPFSWSWGCKHFHFLTWLSLDTSHPPNSEACSSKTKIRRPGCYRQCSHG